MQNRIDQHLKSAFKDAKIGAGVGGTVGILLYALTIYYLFSISEDKEAISREELRNQINTQASLMGFAVDKFGTDLIDSVYSAMTDATRNNATALDILNENVRELIENGRGQRDINSTKFMAILLLALNIIGTAPFVTVAGAAGFTTTFTLSFMTRMITDLVSSQLTLPRPMNLLSGIITPVRNMVQGVMDRRAMQPLLAGETTTVSIPENDDNKNDASIVVEPKQKRH